MKSNAVQQHFYHTRAHTRSLARLARLARLALAQAQAKAKAKARLGVGTRAVFFSSAGWLGQVGGVAHC